MRELDAVIAVRDRRKMCVSDNGTTLTGMAILRWAQERQVEWHYIVPGKTYRYVPTRSGDGELRRRLRELVLQQQRFKTLDRALVADDVSLSWPRQPMRFGVPARSKFGAVF